MNDESSRRKGGQRRRESNVDPYAGAVPETDRIIPVDIAAVNRDDQLLSALAVGAPLSAADRETAELAMLMAALRDDVLAAPMPAQPTIEDVEAGLLVAQRRQKRAAAGRTMRIVSGAAAVMMVVFAGMLVLAESSQPGDPLWGVKKVVFAEQARQTQATVDVRDNLDSASEALASGDTVRVSEYVAKAERELVDVTDGETREEMRRRIAQLRAGLTTSPSTPPSSEVSETSGESTTEDPGDGDPSEEPVPGSSETSAPTSSPTSTTSSSVPSTSESSSVPVAPNPDAE